MTRILSEYKFSNWQRIDEFSASIIVADGIDYETVNDTQTAPGNAVVQIEYAPTAIPELLFRSTGFFVSDRVIVSVAHAFEVRDDQKRLVATAGTNEIRIIPGQTGSDTGAVRMPFGVHGIERYELHPDYGQKSGAQFNPEFDLACIVLRSPVQGTGHFELFSPDVDFLRSEMDKGIATAVRINGYPGKEHPHQMISRGQFGGFDSLGISYEHDTTGGSSGSPVYVSGERAGNVVHRAFGVHSEAITGPGVPDHNAGVRLTPDHLSFITDIIDAS